MPVPKHDPLPVDRPSGLVPPPVVCTGLTEVRVHGVGGTSPEALLGDLAPQHVAGDRVAGFYRTADQADRHVEAYSWGGLTSRSATRVLWLLLLPFMLANVAGWMCAPRVTSGEEPLVRRRLFWHRWAVRVAALGVTLNVVLLVSMTALDVLAYQCGASACADRHWWLTPLTWGPVEAHPARRLALAALVPVVLVVLFGVLSWRSRLRYEDVLPPWKQASPPDGRFHASAAALPGGLADKDFWDGRGSVQRLGRLHSAAALALVALSLAHLAPTAARADATVQAAWLGHVALAVAGLVIAACLALLPVERRWADIAAVLVVGAAVLALGLAAVAAWVQPASPDLPVPAGAVPGMLDVVQPVYAAIAASLMAVAVVALTSARPADPFRWIAPFVASTLAVALANLVLLAACFWVAAFVGEVEWQAAPTDPSAIVVPAAMLTGLGSLSAAMVLTLVVFVLLEVLLWFRAGKTATALLQGEYTCDDARAEARASVLPEPLTKWYASVLDDLGAEVPAARRKQAQKWVRSIGRARRLALAATDAQYLLTVTAVGALLLLGGLVVWLDARPSVLVAAVASIVAGLVPVAGLALARRGWSDLEQRKRLGVLWDVGTFWPRAYHPLAPPSYTERAVPDLQRRLWWLHDSGGSSLLVTHSQGTVLAAAALLQPDRLPEHLRVALVTFGSPLAKLYAWAFPAYVNGAVLTELAQTTTWRNFSYLSDYIGGPVSPAGSDRVQQDVLRTVDRRLQDPLSSRYVYQQPLPALGRHSGYWSDPRMWKVIDSMARRVSAGRAAPAGGAWAPAQARAAESQGPDVRR